MDQLYLSVRPKTFWADRHLPILGSPCAFSCPPLDKELGEPWVSEGVWFLPEHFLQMSVQ